MTLNILETKEEATSVLARYFIQLAKEAIEENNHFLVALSGGFTPQKLHELLTSPPFRDEIDWSKVYFFFGDERYVSHTDKDSNYKMAYETLLKPLDIPDDHIFPVNTTLAPPQAAEDYQQRLNLFFNNNDIKFDLILLGMGDNAHTASLFPYTDILHDKTPGVKAVELPEQKTWRITFNAPLINNAVRIVFLVIGKEKAEAVMHVLTNDPEDIVVDLYPAQLIRNERVAWFLDKDAASLLNQ
ncbi:MAG: 6-phosphogluconolactonase [Taibaiella sp.]|jgi:6-phosphogluconolactonase